MDVLGVMPILVILVVLVILVIRVIIVIRVVVILRRGLRGLLIELQHPAVELLRDERR